MGGSCSVWHESLNVSPWRIRKFMEGLVAFPKEDPLGTQLVLGGCEPAAIRSLCKHCSGFIQTCSPCMYLGGVGSPSVFASRALRELEE